MPYKNIKKIAKTNIDIASSLRLFFILTTYLSFKTNIFGWNPKKIAPTTHPDRYTSLPNSVIPPLRMYHNINPPVKYRENKIKIRIIERKITKYLFKILSTTDIKIDKDFCIKKIVYRPTSKPTKNVSIRINIDTV